MGFLAAGGAAVTFSGLAALCRFLLTGHDQQRAFKARQSFLPQGFPQTLVSVRVAVKRQSVVRSWAVLAVRLRQFEGQLRRGGQGLHGAGVPEADPQWGRPKRGTSRCLGLHGVGQFLQGPIRERRGATEDREGERAEDTLLVDEHVAVFVDLALGRLKDHAVLGSRFPFLANVLDLPRDGQVGVDPLAGPSITDEVPGPSAFLIRRGTRSA